MASKFMAFENVAGTSTASFEENDQNEHIEMNVSQYPNYQTSDNNQETTVPYDEEDDHNENEMFDEKFEKNMSYRKFIHKNSEQLKCICGGLLLLMSSGIHICWGIYRVFSLYNCHHYGVEKTFYFHFVIWSFYIGAIMGNFCAGHAVYKFRKGHLYLVGGALLTISGVLFILSKNDTNIYLVTSRMCGGFIHGLIYVVVVVHASENATKEFRELLMLIVGAALNYSILLSVLVFFHTEGLFNASFLNGFGLIMFGLTTIVISAKHATETVPFILQNDGGELDALQTVSKLKKKPISTRSVHHDFSTMKNLVQDEIDTYGPPNFKKVLLPENRTSLIFCCYGRLCSVLSFNLPLIVFILIFLRGVAHLESTQDQKHMNEHCHDFGIGDNNNEIEVHSHLEEQNNIERLKRETPETEPTIQKPNSMEHDAEYKKNDNSKTENNEEETVTGDSKKDSKDNKSEPHENESSGHARTDEGNTPTTERNNHSEGSENGESKKSSENSQEKGVQNDHNVKNEVNSRAGTEEMKREHEESKSDKEKSNENNKHNKKQEENNKNEKAPTIFGHFITFLHNRELTLVLLAWFIFGSITAAVLYKFNLKRFIYYISCVLSSVLFITAITHSLFDLSYILHICLIIYFNYVTIPLDVFGHCMLAEAFPVTLKGFSVAFVAIIEHLVHIILITLYLCDTFHNSIIIISMCTVAFMSHEIARNLPQKDNLSLGEAREQYKNIDLMLFNNPKIDYNQQQEFI
ncbi:uncharacterized protein LOC116350741 [Contarinia nasturtii]|uniref:uncharacterized protein LOC116350741 n=1 Tax=Contarinia nasturtii TaxID=265458 RepID=UPI0012D49EFD|nr:uncharacterized protein LOC116350741 [Contarinia nasturtii]